MAFAGLSTVLVYKKEKCLVKSGKDKHIIAFKSDIHSISLCCHLHVLVLKS